MDFLFNDLSLHGQFETAEVFIDAISRLMQMRAQAKKRAGREIFCNRSLAAVEVMPGVAMPQAVADLPPNIRRAFLSWLNRGGPFWDDIKMHGSDEFLECEGEIVTDTAMGEAAWCIRHGVEKSLVGLSPSRWETNPLMVIWHGDDEQETVSVNNYWESDRFQIALDECRPPVTDWNALEDRVRGACDELCIAPDAFKFLHGLPFSASAAERIDFLLGILNRFHTCFDEKGNRNEKGQKLYQDFFTGSESKSLFSDSSDDEKRKFKQRLTFSHPNRKGETLFCPWHGKVRRMQLRIHFSWPVRAGEPLYIVYIGEKLTKR